MSDETKREDSKLEKLMVSMTDRKSKLIGRGDAIDAKAKAISEALERRQKFLDSEKPTPAFVDVSEIAAEDYQILKERLSDRLRDSKESPEVQKQLKDQLGKMGCVESYFDYLRNTLSNFHDRHDFGNKKWTFSDYKGTVSGCDRSSWYGPMNYSYSFFRDEFKKRLMTRKEFEGVLEDMILEGVKLIKDHEDELIELKEKIKREPRKDKKYFKDEYARAEEDLRIGRQITEELEYILDESLQTPYSDRTPQTRKPIVQEMTDDEWDEKKTKYLER